MKAYKKWMGWGIGFISAVTALFYMTANNVYVGETITKISINQPKIESIDLAGSKDQMKTFLLDEALENESNEGKDGAKLEYNVVAGRLEPKASKKSKEIWQAIKEFLPDQYEGYIKSFIISTKSQEDSLASVAVLDDENKRFDFEIALDSFVNAKGEFYLESESYATLAHEYMHIVTLCDKQMQSDVQSEKNTFEVLEGITKSSSYLNMFYNKFWTKYKDEIQKEDEEASYKRYEDHEDEFINDYAATNPVEDIAESFAYFVIGVEPKGHSIKEQKIKFFYEFSELIELRKAFREKMDPKELK